MKIDEITRALGSAAPRSVDIAMFGRMTTSSAFEDVQAAVQVAHPLSTHRIQQEFDYYTAVDDISGESGAGFIGDTAFNSATYYKYFNVHWEALVKHLGDAATARRAVEALIEAAVTVHPSGKQNSFAAHNLPDLVLVEVRARNIPVSYVNAFERPVRQSHDRSLMDASVQALVDYMGSVERTFNLQAERAHIATRGVDLVGSTQVTSLDDLLRWLPLEQEQPA
jgi:CRISPR system Cascade subunit CasC